MSLPYSLVVPPSTRPVPEGVVIPNVMQCSLCQGTVDRHQHCFVCRDCNALGDFNTGIMTDRGRPEKSEQTDTDIA